MRKTSLVPALAIVAAPLALPAPAQASPWDCPDDYVCLYDEKFWEGGRATISCAEEEGEVSLGFFSSYNGYRLDGRDRVSSLINRCPFAIEVEDQYLLDDELAADGTTVWAGEWRGDLGGQTGLDNVIDVVDLPPCTDADGVDDSRQISCYPDLTAPWTIGPSNPPA